VNMLCRGKRGLVLILPTSSWSYSSLDGHFAGKLWAYATVMQTEWVAAQCNGRLVVIRRLFAPCSCWQHAYLLLVACLLHALPSDT